jgi:hypothetical protein
MFLRVTGISRRPEAVSAMNTLDRLVVRGICGLAVAMPVMMAEAWIIGRILRASLIATLQLSACAANRVESRECPAIRERPS